MTNRIEALTKLRDAVREGREPVDQWLALDEQININRGQRAFGGSTDAALALCVAMLPDQGWEIYRTAKYPGMIPGSSKYEFAAKVGWGTYHTGEADTPSCALLIAILSALIAEGNA